MIVSAHKTIIPAVVTVALALAGLQACGSSGSGTDEKTSSQFRGQLIGYSKISTGDLYSIPALHYKVVYTTLDIDGSFISAIFQRSHRAGVF